MGDLIKLGADVVNPNIVNHLKGKIIYVTMMTTRPNRLLQDFGRSAGKEERKG